MRNSISESAIILIAASSALFAQNNDFRVKPQNYPNLLDVHQLVESSIAATQRHWQARLHYSYVERDESRRLDLAGRVKSEKVDVSRTLLVNGIPFGQLLERDGRPPSAEEERKQKERLDKWKRETPGKRIEQLRRQKEENASIVLEFPRPSTSNS